MTAAVKRVRLSPEQRRAQLIELGLQMLAERPIEEVSVEELADQAGISRGLLFHYFRSKQEFHLAVATEAAKRLLDCTEPVLTDPPLERMADSLNRLIDHVCENSQAYVSLVRGAASGDAEMREVFERTRDIQARRVLDGLGELGVEVTAVIELTVHGWVAFAEELIVRWLRSCASPDGPVLSRERLLELLATSGPALVVD